MPTFLPYSYRAIFAGIIDTVIHWVTLSAVLSILLVVVALIINPTCGGGACNLFAVDLNTLMSYPFYSPLIYYQVLWVVLLVATIVGAIIYMINLSQVEDMEVPVDYFTAVAKPAITYTALALFVWLVAPVAYIILRNPNYLPSDILNQGLVGLQAIGATAPLSAGDYIYNYLLAYFPLVVYVVAIFYTLRNAHTGWLGNKWWAGG